MPVLVQGTPYVQISLCYVLGVMSLLHKIIDDELVFYASDHEGKGFKLKDYKVDLTCMGKKFLPKTVDFLRILLPPKRYCCTSSNFALSPLLRERDATCIPGRT